MFRKYAATQKMTGSEQARSGHFCLCGYAAVAALTSASRRRFCRGGCTHVWLSGQASLGAACAAGQGLRSKFRGLPARFPLKMIHWIIFRALQARKSRETADGACSNLTAPGFFIGPRRLFAVPHRLNWRKLPDSVFKSVRPPKVFAQLYYETNPYAKDKKLLNGYTSPFPPCETPAGGILCYESGQGCNRGSWRFPA